MQRPVRLAASLPPALPAVEQPDIDTAMARPFMFASRIDFRL